jgi:hypothetical protein
MVFAVSAAHGLLGTCLQDFVARIVATNLEALMQVRSVAVVVGLGFMGLLAFACGEDSGNSQTDPCANTAPTACSCANGQTGTAMCINGSPSGCSCQNPVGAGDAGNPGATTTGGGTTGSGATPGAGSFGGTTTGGATAGGATPGGAVDAGSTGGSGKDAGTTGGMPGGGMTGGQMPATGPKDGDPAKPVVTADGVACRMSGGAGGAIGGLGSPNAMVGGRDLIVDYPCGKREGAHMTVILNLHGTLISGAPWQYQRGYFAAYRLVDTSNLIVVQPHSASTRMGGAQWGVMDNGADLPHLLEVIDWVYKTFSKFQIRGLWVAGHSQGSMYVKTFACNEMIASKVRGVIGMSGGAFGVGQSFGGAGAGNAACAARVSQIHTVGDAETGATGGLPDQTAAAMAHGCAAKIGPMDIGNMQMVTTWPSCSPGWVHFNVTMGAHEHTTSINPEVVKYIIDQVKSTEL